MPTEYEQYLDAFVAFRDLQFIVWKLEVRNHPYHRATLANSVRAMLQDVRAFVERAGE